jgi:hypothetical protein
VKAIFLILQIEKFNYKLKLLKITKQGFNEAWNGLIMDSFES